MIRKLLFSLCLVCLYINLNAQDIEVGFTAGTGSIYMIENRGENADINYNAPIVYAAMLKYTPENAYFGIQLKYQNLNAIARGDDWQHVQYNDFGSIDFDGTIENRTLLVQLEHISSRESQFNFGYNFGLGGTTEELSYDKKGENTFKNSFSVINAGALVTYSLNEALNLRFEPSFLWNDPINSLYSDRYRMAGEDINLLFQLGLTYKIN